MLFEQRKQLILRELDIHHLLTISDIVKLTRSSEATIRRDLELLSQQGLLTRIHGGCKKHIILDINETTMNERSLEHMIAKNKIASYVSRQFIRDNMVIYLDAGTSTHAIIPFLNHKDILIVTNGIHHVTPLIQQGIKVILLGGYVKTTTQAIIGAVCLQQLSHYSFDLAIIGANAIDDQFGISTPDIEEAKVKQLAIKSSEQAIIIADHSKFDKKSFAKIAAIEDCLIYTDQCPQKYQHFSTIKEVL